MFAYITKMIKELLYRKRNIVFFVVAVLMVGALALTAGTNQKETVPVKPTINIGIIDTDRSIYSSLILNYFNNTKSITDFANVTLDNKENIEELFNEGKLLAYLVIPKNFANSLMNVEAASIEVVLNTSNLMYSVMLKNTLDSYGTYITNVQVVSSGLYSLGKIQGMKSESRNKMNINTSLELIKLALNRDVFFDKREVSTLPATPVLQYYLWAILTLLVLITATLSGSNFLKERQLGTYERLRIAGHSIRRITLVILIVNSLFWILCFNLLLPILTGLMKCSASFEVYLFIDLCILMFNVLFLLIAIFCSNSHQYALVSTFGLMLIAVVGGVLIPISFLPERFLAFSRLTPTYHMIHNLISFIKGSNSINIWLFVLFSLAVILILYGLCCIILKRQKKEQRGRYDEAVE